MFVEETKGMKTGNKLEPSNCPLPERHSLCYQEIRPVQQHMQLLRRRLLVSWPA